jgi:hypothetical protein
MISYAGWNSMLTKGTISHDPLGTNYTTHDMIRHHTHDTRTTNEFDVLV